jgi:hypothetical protein
VIHGKLIPPRLYDVFDNNKAEQNSDGRNGMGLGRTARLRPGLCPPGRDGFAKMLPLFFGHGFSTLGSDGGKVGNFLGSNSLATLGRNGSELSNLLRRVSFHGLTEFAVCGGNGKSELL